MTAEKLGVTPINPEALAKHIEAMLPPGENQSYKTKVAALVGENVMTDNECVYHFLEKKLHNGKIQFVYEVPIRVKTKTTEGSCTPMFPSFYVDIATEDLKPFMNPATSLREFMGRRYKYNPRIETNTREFLKEIGAALSASGQTAA